MCVCGVRVRYDDDESKKVKLFWWEGRKGGARWQWGMYGSRVGLVEKSQLAGQVERREEYLGSDGNGNGV